MVDGDDGSHWAITEAKWEARYLADYYEKVQRLLHPGQPADATDLDQAVANQVWGNMVLERHAPDAAILTRETMRVVPLAKPFALHNLTKLWDPLQQRVVHGDAVLDVVPRVVAARHAAQPKPLTQAEANKYGPPRVGSQPEATYNAVITARKAQIVRELRGEIHRGLLPVHGLGNHAYDPEPAVRHDDRRWVCTQAAEASWPARRSQGVADPQPPPGSRASS